MATFIQGLELSRRYFFEIVQPILRENFPNLNYSVGLLGSGSEVLGFDTEMSSDHHWGPRVMMVLQPEDLGIKDTIWNVLAEQLPYEFLGYSTNFAPPDMDDNGTQQLEQISTGQVNHRVEMTTIPEFFQSYLGFDIDEECTAVDWLTFPEQKLRTIFSGDVFHDDLGLQAIREKFAYYPHDVWLYLLASGWARIGQEEHLMPRAGFVGDELGSAIIGSRLVRDVMHLCFLMERTYAPYPKWFGTAFARLEAAQFLTPILQNVQFAQTWQDREGWLSKAYAYIAQKHNDLQITEPLPIEVSSFFGRPFQVIHAERFSEALIAKIQDPTVKAIAERTMIGNISQFSDSTDLKENTALRKSLRLLYIGME